MAELIEIEVEKIDPNPHRGLAAYPWIERKIEQLMRSISDVGFWEGVIVRRAGERVELAFGHHRIEAARRLKLHTIPVYVRDLDDTQMLKFMGRENGEDYASDFLIMLNTWEAAVKFLPQWQFSQRDIDIARFLGWITSRTDREKGTISPVARACAAAFNLLKDGHITRDMLVGLNVFQARELLERGEILAKHLEKEIESKKLPPREARHHRTQFAQALGQTINEVRQGKVALAAVRKRVDANIKGPEKPSQQPPLFSEFAESLLGSMRIALNGDVASQYLARVKEALPHVTLVKDQETIADIQHELGEIEKRAAHWRKQITPRLRVIK